MLTPLLIIAMYFLVLVLWILVWRVCGGDVLCEWLYEVITEQCLRSKVCKKETKPTRFLVDDLFGGRRKTARQSEFEPEPEPEPEPELAMDPFDTRSFILDTQTEQAQRSEGICGSSYDGHGWQFRMWWRGRGEWQDFDDADQNTLTAADELGQTIVELERGKFTYEVDLKKLEQRNQGTNRTRKIRRPARGLLYRYRLTRFYMEHNWDKALRGLIRMLLLYLLVGYTFLSGTALEPIACKADLDLSEWVEAAPSIQCDWCPDTTTKAVLDPVIRIQYRTLACLSIACFVIYGFGVPLTFGSILYWKRDQLKSNDFAKVRSPVCLSVCY